MDWNYSILVSPRILTLKNWINYALHSTVIHIESINSQQPTNILDGAHFNGADLDVAKPWDQINAQ